MNQEQRKFLIAQVEKTCDAQIEELEHKIPEKPSLNNYLIAAFLDNSIQFADIEVLKEKMRKAVLKFGHSDQLIKSEDSYYSRRQRDESKEVVCVDPNDLFVIPQNYLDALAAYEKTKADIERQVSALKHTKDTIILKLQIGSSATLDKLVMQVDNIGDLNIINTQLLIENQGEK